MHETTDNSMPFSATVLGEYGIRTYTPYPTFNDRTSLLGQLVLSRSFDFLSFLVSPTIVSNGEPMPDVPANMDKSFFALQAAARIKLTKHSGFIIDYAHSFSSYSNTAASGMHDPLGFGW